MPAYGHPAAVLVGFQDAPPWSEGRDSAVFAVYDWRYGDVVQHNQGPSVGNRGERLPREPLELSFAHAVFYRPIAAIRAEGVRCVRDDPAEALLREIDEVVAGLGIVRV